MNTLVITSSVVLKKLVHWSIFVILFSSMELLWIHLVLNISHYTITLSLLLLSSAPGSVTIIAQHFLIYDPPVLTSLHPGKYIHHWGRLYGVIKCYEIAIYGYTRKRYKALLPSEDGIIPLEDLWTNSCTNQILLYYFLKSLKTSNVNRAVYLD